MQTNRTLVLTGIALALLLSGCVRAVYDETPTASGATSPLPYPVSPPATPTTAALPSIYLEPAALQIDSGETATVNVWIDSAPAIGGILIEMGFDPAVVQVQDDDSTAEGVQIAPGALPPGARVVENQVLAGEQGTLLYQLSMQPGSPLQGSTRLAIITLQGRSAGVAVLRFVEVAAVNDAGSAVPLQPLSTGTVTVSGTVASQPTSQPTAQPPASPATSGIYYVVQRGENLYRIGLHFDISGEAIARANNISNPDQVPAGTLLVVPVDPPHGRFGYYVQPGDTLSSVARSFETTVNNLATWNGLSSDAQLRVGQILVVAP